METIYAVNTQFMPLFKIINKNYDLTLSRQLIPKLVCVISLSIQLLIFCLSCQKKTIDTDLFFFLLLKNGKRD